MKIYREYLKRLIDLVISLAVFLIVSPFLLIIIILLAMANKGNPFFFQRRPGRHGKVFLLIKFKTMNEARDRDGNLLPDEKRLTPLGKFVRKTSLDEMPQLLHVILGDMSLVGPRPLLVEYLPLYTSEQMRRHDVRPGITGWAQVNGRNSISWEKKFELDTWYVDHVSLSLDLRICWLTVKIVFKTEGISQQGHATMPSFKGINNS